MLEQLQEEWQAVLVQTCWKLEPVPSYGSIPDDLSRSKRPPVVECPPGHLAIRSKLPPPEVNCPPPPSSSSYRYGSSLDPTLALVHGGLYYCLRSSAQTPAEVNG